MPKSKRLNLIFFLFILFMPSLMKAEGQDGIGKIYSLFDLLMKISNGLLFTFILGVLINLVLKRVFVNLSKLHLISFSTAFIIVVLLQIIYKPVVHYKIATDTQIFRH